jgi:hypothetical protein
MDHDEWEAKYSQLIAKAWTDEAFKKRFLEDPATVLKEYGMEMPSDMKVKVVEGTDEEVYLILPPRPSGELSEEDLRDLTAAPAYTWCHQCKIEEEEIIE